MGEKGGRQCLLSAIVLLPVLAQGGECRRTAACNCYCTLFHLTILLISHFKPVSIYEFCIVNHVPITEKSFCCCRLITSPGKWEPQLLGSWSCKSSMLSAASPCRHPQSSSTTAAPAACTASQSLLHRQNHCQSCVFQREALVYTGLMVLTVSLLLHCSLKTRCGLWFATRLSTKLA